MSIVYIRIDKKKLKKKIYHIKNSFFFLDKIRKENKYFFFNKKNILLLKFLLKISPFSYAKETFYTNKHLNIFL